MATPSLEEVRARPQRVDVPVACEAIGNGTPLPAPPPAPVTLTSIPAP